MVPCCKTSTLNKMVFVNSISLVYVMCVAMVMGQGVQTNHNGILDSESTGAVEDTCDNPEYETLKGRLLLNYDSFEELYRLPPFAASSSLPKYARSNDSFYCGSRQECVNLQSQANNQGGLTCPGRVVINRDVNRVPCVVSEHKCLCRQCLIPHSLQSRRMHNGCEPIRQYIPVMRRSTDPTNEGEEWSFILEPFVVGCTCAYRRQVFPSRS